MKPGNIISNINEEPETKYGSLKLNSVIGKVSQST